MALVFETMLGPVEVPREVVEEIISVELTNCFHWICPGIDLDYDSVMDFLEGKQDPELLKRIARYIIVYAENLVLTNYVYQRILNPENADKYLASMKPLLAELRRLYGLLHKKPYDVYRPLVDEMLNLCLRYGIDRSPEPCLHLLGCIKLYWTRLGSSRRRSDPLTVAHYRLRVSGIGVHQVLVNKVKHYKSLRSITRY